MSRALDKALCRRRQKEVALEHLLRLTQLLLRLLEIEINVERCDELGDGVRVLVQLLLDDADEVLELLLVGGRVAAACPVGDDGGGNVAEDPGGGGLDAVDVGGGEKEVKEDVLGGLVVEEGEERPVNQPGAVVELAEGIVEELVLNQFAHFLDFVHGALPVHEENLAREFTPCGRGGLVGVGGEDAELVEEIRGGGIRAAAVLGLAKIVEDIDHFRRNLDPLARSR